MNGKPFTENMQVGGHVDLRWWVRFFSEWVTWPRERTRDYWPNLANALFGKRNNLPRAYSGWTVYCSPGVRLRMDVWKGLYYEGLNTYGLEAYLLELLELEGTLQSQASIWKLQQMPCSWRAVHHRSLGIRKRRTVSRLKQGVSPSQTNFQMDVWLCRVPSSFKFLANASQPEIRSPRAL